MEPKTKSEQMTELGFQFKIGDHVAHVSEVVGFQPDPLSALEGDAAISAGKFADWAMSQRPPSKFLVVERLVQECHGGFQFFYKCRQMFDRSRGISQGLIDLTACEVVPYPTKEAK